jgi:hypothetical protein
MSKLGTANAEQIGRMKADAAVLFGPFMLGEALRRLCRIKGSKCLDEFEKAIADQIEKMPLEAPDLDDLRELAIEQLYAAVREARCFPDSKQPLEDPKARRTQGRSEDSGTLEEQLQSGLEDTFPASDPPSVVSTAISGRAKELVGVEEVLREKRKEKAET